MFTMRGAFGTGLAALLALVPLGCGGGDGGGDEKGAAPEAPAAESAPAVAVANPATIRGQVQFQGTPAQQAAIDMSEEPTCAAKHPGGAKTEAVVVNGNGTLRNVFVYVKQGLPAGQRHPAPSTPVTIDQQGCVYHPHVLGIQTGQQLTVKNSDGLLHNINAKPSTNRGFNISQPRDMESTRTFSAQEVMIPVECDVHGWMKAYIGVVDHPYFAVTGDDGTFEIANLPPGSYVLEAWHEQYGPQTINVTVGPNETKEAANFTYDASAAQTAVVPLGRPIDLHDHGGAAHAPAASGRK